MSFSFSFSPAKKLCPSLFHHPMIYFLAAAASQVRTLSVNCTLIRFDFLALFIPHFLVPLDHFKKYMEVLNRSSTTAKLASREMKYCYSKLES